MQKVRVTTDSACDMKQSYLKQYNVDIMYYYIELEKGRLQKDSEIKHSDVKEYMDNDMCLINTVPASVEEYRDFFLSHVAHGEILLHFCVSSKISPAYRYACQAAVEIPNVIIVDSKTLSVALGIMVLAAAREAAQGETNIKKILNVAQSVCERTQSTFVVNSLKYLLSTNKLFVHHIPFSKHIHSVFCMSKGTIRLRKLTSLSNQEGIERFIKKEFRNIKNIDTSFIFFSSVGISKQRQKKLIEVIKKCVPFQQILIGEPSVVIGSNAGKGSYSLVYLLKKAED